MVGRKLLIGPAVSLLPDTAQLEYIEGYEYEPAEWVNERQLKTE